VSLVSSSTRGRVVLAAVIVAGLGLRADAQVLPSEPLTFGNGWLTVGGDVSATASCASVRGVDARCTPDTGYFNYTDYEQSVLRMVIVSVSAAVKAGSRVSVLSEVRSENGRRPEPYALYVRVTPFPSRGFAIQAGRVPPTFGAFARRRYATDNLLIGYPLAYQYLTSLRPDALPANADELLAMRGRGWLSNFSIGNTDRDNGLPLVNAFRWDTGLQVHMGGRLADATVGVTTGTLGNPLVGDDNSGRQVAGRVTLRPVAGLAAGFSAARGPFVTTDALRAAGADPDARRYSQTAWGADLEYSRDYYLIRFEGILSEWRVPLIHTAGDLPLRATSASLEGRYKIQPGLYAAARVDHLSFSRIGGTTRRDGWDAPVTRVEVGGGYSLQRNIVLKVSFQRNSRQTSRAPTVNALATQLAYWF
jgi:hypothetical protein